MYCECFDVPNEREIRSCINNLDRINELRTLLERPSDQITFILKLSENCDRFKTYFEKQLYQKGNYSDHEYTEKIYEMLSYFKDDSFKEIPTRTVQIEPNNSGLIFNLFLNKVRSDIVLESGTHDIERQDSIIPFENSTQKLTITDICETATGKHFEIDVVLNYQLKRESLYDLWSNIGTNYEKMVIIPSVKSLITKRCSFIVSVGDESKNTASKLNMLNDLRDLMLKYDYFIFESFQIIKVKE